MNGSHPGLDFLRYIIFTLGGKIPKHFGMVLLFLLEFVIVYQVYSFVDKQIDLTPATKTALEDRNSVNVDDLPIAYRRYYAHHNLENK